MYVVIILLKIKFRHNLGQLSKDNESERWSFEELYDLINACKDYIDSRDCIIEFKINSD